MELLKERKIALDAGFEAQFGTAPARYFSAPGRTELSGNHTDHQRGCVLAAAVNLDMQAAVRGNQYHRRADSRRGGKIPSAGL